MFDRVTTYYLREIVGGKTDYSRKLPNRNVPKLK
jgi:hypothetical protein